MSFDKIVETAIQEAQARGEFDNLPGQGKPIDLTEYFNTPEDLRVAQAMLKNAGMVPAEIELLQDIAALRESLESATGIDTVKIRKVLEEKQLQFNLLLEGRRRQLK
jgi:hypothetical protein